MFKKKKQKKSPIAPVFNMENNIFELKNIFRIKNFHLNFSHFVFNCKRRKRIDHKGSTHIHTQNYTYTHHNLIIKLQIKPVWLVTLNKYVMSWMQINVKIVISIQYTFRNNTVHVYLSIKLWTKWKENRLMHNFSTHACISLS